jgi:hypothetical protein
VALGESLEEYFSAAPGSAGGVPDPAALLTARAIAQSAAATKSTALSAAAGPLDEVRAAIAESHARYGGIAAGVDKRKAALLEFDAYKRKVEALRAAPPKSLDLPECGASTQAKFAPYWQRLPLRWTRSRKPLIFCKPPFKRTGHPFNTAGSCMTAPVTVFFGPC